MKKCSKCKLKKLITDFIKDKSKNHGVRNQCKKCRNKYLRQYYQAHKENEHKKAKRFRQRHKQKLRIYWTYYNQAHKRKQAEYYKTHKEELTKRNKAYYQTHKKKLLRQSQLWRQTPNGKMFYDHKSHRRRTFYQTTDLTTEWLLDLRQKTEICEICKCQMIENGRKPNGKNLDHMIPLNMGGTHTMDNVRYICRTCNLQRPKNGSDLLAFL